MEPMFVDGFEHSIKVSAEYGGAVKLNLYGVREIYFLYNTCAW